MQRAGDESAPSFPALFFFGKLVSHTKVHFRRYFDKLEQDELFFGMIGKKSLEKKGERK